MRKRQPTTVCNSCGKTIDREDAVLNKKTGIIKESICKPCRKQRFNRLRVKENKRVPDEYRKYLGDTCVRCGFAGLPCQMDVDHINGDSTDNSISNLRTLCANCHRIATYSVNDY